MQHAAPDIRCFGRLLSEFLHFVGHDCEPFASFPGAGGFDSGVEGEQIGLLRDRGDDFDDFADFRARFAQLAHGCVGGFGSCDCFGRDLRGLHGILGDFVHGGAHFLSARRDGLQVAVDMLAGFCDYACLGGSLFRVGRDLMAGSRHLLAGTGHVLRVFRDGVDHGTNADALTQSALHAPSGSQEGVSAVFVHHRISETSRAGDGQVGAPLTSRSVHRLP